MKVEAVFGDLRYVDLVDSKKTSYCIFQGPKHYLSISFAKPNSGYFTVVDPEAVEFVAARFAGKTITRKTLTEHPQSTKYIPAGFDVFHILYVLVALKRAKIDRALSKGAGTLLHFRIKAKKARPATPARLRVLGGQARLNG